MQRLIALSTAAFTLLLGSCGPLAGVGGPTDRFIIEPVGDDIGSRGGQTFGGADENADVPDMLERRLEAFGLVVHNISVGQNGRVTVETSGDRAEEIMAEAIYSPGKLRLALVDMSADPFGISTGVTPPGAAIMPMADGSYSMAVRRLGGIDGAFVSYAAQTYDDQTGEPAIAIEFTQEGATRLARMTSANVGQQMAVVVDDEVLSAATIYEPVTGGRLQLAGGYSLEDAQRIAAIINSGALPVRYRVAGRTALN